MAIGEIAKIPKVGKAGRAPRAPSKVRKFPTSEVAPEPDPVEAYHAGTDPTATIHERSVEDVLIAQSSHYLATKRRY